ncbi:MAG: hydantoinase B/oxoprolinase family protein [Deltaproteobacteria bacterium]|nr:hydantoinase B/oxoprolinase family protein [Deltaproteobacteria bacterium]
MQGREGRLDPVTFEVLKNAFVNLVDQMSEQILRTCYSFVIYCRDFSNALCDARGNTVMQGSQDIAVHVGTLHFTAKAVLDAFADDLHAGDVYLINDPYLGGTHFCDVRVIRPVFVDGELIALLQSNGHWADVGGSVPGSFNIVARDHYGEGMRIPPVKVWDRGVYRKDVAGLLAANMRLPEDRLGDLRAQAEATKVGERRLLELIRKYGKETVLEAFRECQDYVERVVRAQLAELPRGSWETEDYIDADPTAGEGMIPIKVKLSITEDGIHYDMTGSHPTINCFLNSGYGATYSAVIAGTKTFFPQVPLNSGFYRVVTAYAPEGSVVNAPHPVAVTGFCSGAYEKVMNSIFELWSNLMPERALACSFNLEYLLIGGWDLRPGYGAFFMWYDWMSGGWGARSAKDGSNATAPVFGLGLSIQPLEGQERLCPVVTTKHELVTDSGGPGRFRGGCGVEKGGVLMQAERAVISYCCDRARSVTWGILGGLPSIPHGAWLNPGRETERYLGAVFSAVPIQPGDAFTRPSAGGGGLGDPLERDPQRVLEDVVDGYVSIERAKKDYGVVVRAVDPEVCEYEVDLGATKREREWIRERRLGWLAEDPESVRQRWLRNEIDVLDAIRRHGVIFDWGAKTVLPRTTEQFRAMLRRRAAAHWDGNTASREAGSTR